MRTAPALAGSLECYWRRKTKQIKGDRDDNVWRRKTRKKKKKKTYGWEEGWERTNDIKNKKFWECYHNIFTIFSQYYLMSTNKFISYPLCNKGIIVNLYKLHFLSSHFSFQPNKRVFHPSIFPSLQPNTHEGKLNIFYPSTFLSSH